MADELSKALRFATDPKIDWPHYNSYLNNCSQCGVRFCGPKRAPSCWSCAPEGTKTWWHSKFEKSEQN